MRAILAFAIAIACALGACDRVLVPRRDVLRDLQNLAGRDTGTVTGAVFLAAADWPESALVWRAPRTPLPGAVVELGVWAGPPETFRDTVRGGPPTDVADARFEVIARATADAEGAWRFAGLPRQTAFALRARPPEGVDARPAYLGTLFWLYHSATMALPIVLRHESREHVGR